MLAHYDYDHQGLLHSCLRGNGVQTGFDYDAASRLDELATELTGSTPSQIRTLGFDYNPAGQITERTDTGGNYAFAGHTNQTTVYDHNALNQIIDITETGAVTRTLTPQWTAGNLTSDGERSFGYDPFNRLTSVTGGGQSDVDLDYDPLGRLSEVDVTGGVQTRFLYDGAAMIAEYDGSGVVMRRYVHGPGMDAPIVQIEGSAATPPAGARRWLLADERGSIYAHTDEAGAVVQINTYDEYGVPGQQTIGRFGYTGQIWLAEAGLYHYKARAYHAELGVFMQADPIGHSGGINLYAYVGGDPVNYTDPWGLKAEERGPCTGTRIPRTNSQCELMLGVGGARSLFGMFGGGAGGAGGSGGSLSCSGDVNNDKCTVTAKSGNRYPSYLIGSIFHRLIPTYDQYRYFRRNYRAEFEFSVAVLGEVPFESVDQAMSVLEEADKLYREIARHQFTRGLLGIYTSSNLWSAGFPQLSAYFSFEQAFTISGSINSIADAGVAMNYGFQYINWTKTCAAWGVPLRNRGWAAQDGGLFASDGCNP